MRRRYGVLVSVGLAAALAVVPRTTASTHVDTFASVIDTPTLAPRSSWMPVADDGGTVVDDTATAERKFAQRPSRAVELPPPPPPPTTTTTLPRRVVVTTTTTTPVIIPPEPPETNPAPVVSSDVYQPPDGCMVDREKTYDEMVGCWDSLVRRWSWPSITKVFSVMFCESKGNPYAGQTHPYHGLMQIGPGGPFDPYDNMVEAWRKSSGGTNWSQWSCR